MNRPQPPINIEQKVKLLLHNLGIFPLAKAIYSLPGTFSGFFKYHFFKKKRFVLILSTMRSGSTLLKALLSNAPDIDQIPEAFFQIRNNKYYTYNQFSKLSSSEIVILKEPSHYPTYNQYPQFPNIEHKTITLVRNPADTIISLRKMNKELGINMTDEELLDYWLVTTSNLLKHRKNLNNRTVVYEQLTDNPIEITKNLFQFIESEQKEGVDTYTKPRKYKWEWKKDDGGEIIKSLKVQKIIKDYSVEKSLINLIDNNNNVLTVMREFGIPKVWDQNETL